MSNDTKARNKRLRLTRKEIDAILYMVGGHLETEDDEDMFRHGESAATKLRAHLLRLIEAEGKR